MVEINNSQIGIIGKLSESAVEVDSRQFAPMGRVSVLGLGVLAVFLFSCIGYPSQSGFKPKSGRSQAWDAFHYPLGNGISPRYEAQKEFIRIVRDAPGLVLSDIDAPYLNALLPKPFVAAPIDDHHYYSYSRVWHYGKAEAIRFIQSGLDHATPVYALLVPSIDDDHATVALWNSVKKSVSQFEIASWELHLRWPDILVHNKQSSRFQCLLDLIKKVFKLKHMV